MTRPTNGEELYELLLLGMVAMREDMNWPATPTAADCAAVWVWAQRAAADDGLEHSLLENVMDGQAWADWQGGSIVFRLTPAGIAHVEGLIGKSPSGSLDGLMREMDMDPDAIKAELARTPDA